MKHSDAPLSAEDAAEQLGLTAETRERLAAYLALLGKWNPRINLVGPNTLADAWRRHILDSGQLYRYLPTKPHRLVDIGSGAGLPGLILAIMGAPDVHLIESDQRKCVFLREAARITAAKVTIHAVRVEAVAPLEADVMTARALASVANLLPSAGRHLRAGGRCLFLKGSRLDEELTEAKDSWNISATIHPSLADPAGVILKIEAFSPGAARTK